jgi:hypothetical protein
MLAQNFVIRASYSFPKLKDQNENQHLTFVKNMFRDYLEAIGYFEINAPYTRNYLNMEFWIYFSNQGEKTIIPWKKKTGQEIYFEKLKNTKEGTPWHITINFAPNVAPKIPDLKYCLDIEIIIEPAIFHKISQTGYNKLIGESEYSFIVYENVQFIDKMAKAMCLFVNESPKPVFEYKPNVNDIGYVITAGTDFTSKKLLNDIFSDLKGDILICDPFFGTRTLDILSLIGKEYNIKFLTQQIETKKIPIQTFSREYDDFRKEFKHSEFRICKKYELHDRIIIDNKKAWHIGHSLKDIGGKDTIINPIGVDLREAAILQFNNRWDMSQPIGKIDEYLKNN